MCVVTISNGDIPVCSMQVSEILEASIQQVMCVFQIFCHVSRVFPKPFVFLSFHYFAIVSKNEMQRITEKSMVFCRLHNHRSLCWRLFEQLCKKFGPCNNNLLYGVSLSWYVLLCCCHGNGMSYCVIITTHLIVSLSIITVCIIIIQPSTKNNTKCG